MGNILRKAKIKAYGSRQEVQYRATKCLARFLNGCPVIAVWCKYPEQKDWMLILSTDLTLTPEQIIKRYARRWKIEPMFNEIKHSYGVARRLGTNQSKLASLGFHVERGLFVDADALRPRQCTKESRRRSFGSMARQSPRHRRFNPDGTATLFSAV